MRDFRSKAPYSSVAEEPCVDQLGTSATINAIPFFERYGYAEASRGVKAFGPDCWVPVAFLRKPVPRLARARGAGQPVWKDAEPHRPPCLHIEPGRHRREEQEPLPHRQSSG